MKEPFIFFPQKELEQCRSKSTTAVSIEENLKARCVSCPPGFMQLSSLDAQEQKDDLLLSLRSLKLFRKNTNLIYGIESMSIKNYSGKDFFELQGVVGAWLAGIKEGHKVSCSCPLPLVVYATLGITEIWIRN